MEPKLFDPLWGHTIPILIITLLFVGCSDAIVQHYATLPEARQDRLFERGWLPDILPSTTTQLRIENDLDLNTSEGEFTFAVAQWPAFKENLAADVRPDVSLSNRSDHLESTIPAGYMSWRYQNNDSNWVFFCKPEAGHCTYQMRKAVVD